MAKKQSKKRIKEPTTFLLRFSDKREKERFKLIADNLDMSLNTFTLEALRHYTSFRLKNR